MLRVPLGLLDISRQTSAVCSPRIIPRQQLIDPALPVTVDDGSERGGQVGQRIDRIELTGLDERCDGRPVLCSGIVARKERVFPVQCSSPFILPMSAMKSRFITAGIRISAIRFPFAALKNERQVAF